MNTDFTVVIPAFNAARTITSTLQSIAESSYIPREVVLVNDGSTDNTVSEVANFNCTLNISLVNQENQGISSALNRGIELVKTPYVARLDADDLVHPRRFEKQIKFLVDNPEIDIVGSAIQEFDDSSLERYYPKSEIAVFLRSTHSTVVAHPSLMAKTCIMSQFKYDKRYDGLEDHELWCRMLVNDVHITNLTDILTYYRVHRNQVTSTPTQETIALKNKLNKHFTNHRSVRSRLFTVPILKSLNQEEVRELAVAIIKNPIVRVKFRFRAFHLLCDQRILFRVRLRLCLVILGIKL